MFATEKTWPAVVLATVLAAIGAVQLASQITVTDEALGVTRACGSAIDGLVDRVGWESWWLADLGEPDDSVRSALVRTSECPGALNTRSTVAVCNFAAAALVASLGRRFGKAVGESSATPEAEARLGRLGALSSAVGAALAALGLIGLAILVADDESTLFLYVDRSVVAVAGLVILIPPLALLILGRGLTILSSKRQGVSDSVTRESAEP